MIEPGIYFGLDADTYHADTALGSTDLKRLLTSGPDYWWHSRMNPARPLDNDTPSLLFGRAVHSMVLDGPVIFNAQFEREADPDGLLVTDADMLAWIEANAERIAAAGFDKVPKTKAGKAGMIAAVDPTARILDDIKARAAAEGRIILPGESYDRIVTAATMIRKNPGLVSAFEGGEAEVSVFWNVDLDDGGAPIRCKCRLDYLKVRAIGDLKSIRNVFGLPFPQACRRAFASYRYDVQAAHYMAGRAQVREHVEAGRVYGAEVDNDWLQRVAAADEFAFVFVFFQATDAPITWGTSLSPGSPILDFAGLDVRRALETFQRFRTTFGPDEAWVLTEPITELDLAELPGWYGRSV